MLVCALLLGGGQAAASTPHDLTGTWSCCGSGGASAQTWTISAMDKASGNFSGTGLGGSIKMDITGNANGDAVTLTTAYTGSSYSATFKGTLSADSKTMSGSWESTSSQKGTWTATRPSAPTPGDPNAPDPNAPEGTKARATPGDIYVIDSGVNNGLDALYKVNPESGQSSIVHVGPPFTGVRGLAFGPEGNLFLTDIGAHAILKLDLKNGAVTRVTAVNEPFLGPPGESSTNRGSATSSLPTRSRGPSCGSIPKPASSNGSTTTTAVRPTASPSNPAARPTSPTKNFAAC